MCILSCFLLHIIWKSVSYNMKEIRPVNTPVFVLGVLLLWVVLDYPKMHVAHIVILAGLVPGGFDDWSNSNDSPKRGLNAERWRRLTYQLIKCKVHQAMSPALPVRRSESKSAWLKLRSSIATSCCLPESVAGWVQSVSAPSSALATGP